MTAFLTGLGTGVCVALALVIFVGARQLRLEARAKREAAEQRVEPEPTPVPPEPGYRIYARPIGGTWVDLGEVKVPISAEPAQLQYGSIRLSPETIDAYAASAFCDSITDEWSRE